MSDAIQLLAMLFGMVGAILNARMNILGFVLWLFSNILLLVIALQHGLYPAALLQLFYAVTCLYGIVTWMRKRKTVPASTATKAASLRTNEFRTLH
ncbi:MAG: nicotinamide mononucleotide transporter [Rhodocyclaceae bacterium]|nr:nicotinamide mononucleotide transporter [Rhodocyclaceae bacterium]